MFFLRGLISYGMLNDHDDYTMIHDPNPQSVAGAAEISHPPLVKIFDSGSGAMKANFCDDSRKYCSLAINGTDIMTSTFPVEIEFSHSADHTT